MAVPPAGAQIIFEAILKSFAKIPYEFVEPTKNFNLNIFKRESQKVAKMRLMPTINNYLLTISSI